MKTDSLTLLIPQQLPTRLDLSTEKRAGFLAVLRLVVEATSCSSTDLVLGRLDRALSLLGETERSPVTVSPTQVALSLDKISDYDQYFGVSHTRAEDVSVALVSSIIIAFREMLLLSKSNQFDPDLLATLKQGYSSYFSLVLRSVI